MTHLQQEQDVVYTHAMQYTDVCASQYKCCSSFLDISRLDEQLPQGTASRSYFGPLHGKSKCDGEGALIKTMLRKAVQAQEVVATTAAEIATFFTSKAKFNPKGTLHSLDHKARTVQVINDIDRSQKGPRAVTLNEENISCEMVKWQQEIFHDLTIQMEMEDM